MSWKSRGEVSSKSSVSRKCTLFLCLGCFCAGLLFTNRYKWVFSHMGFWLVPSFLHFFFLFISVVGVSDFVRNSVLGSVLLDFLLSSSSIYLFYWCIISWYGCEWFFRNLFCVWFYVVIEYQLCGFFQIGCSCWTRSGLKL